MKTALRGLALGFTLGLLIEFVEAVTPLHFGADVPAWPFWLGLAGLVIGTVLALTRRD